MGLLDNIGSISKSVDSTLGGISGKLNDLTSVAKGVLCLPTMIAGFTSSIPGLIGGITTGINTALNNIVAAATATVQITIQNAVDEIAGKITDVTARVNGLIGDAQNAIGQVAGFIDYLKASVDDVKSFVSDKENCNFEGATLGKCIVQQTINNLTKKDLRDTSAGVLSITSLTDKVSGLSDASSVVKRTADKHTKQLKRAAKISNILSK